MQSLERMNKKMLFTEATVQSVLNEKFDSFFQIVRHQLNFILREFQSFRFVLGVVEPIPVGQPAKDYLDSNVNPTLIKALTALCKEKPKDPVVNRSLSSCLIHFSVSIIRILDLVSR